MTTLRIDGEVAKPCEISFETFAAFEAQDQIADVTELGARRPGQAVKLAALLAHVEKKDSGRYIGLHASHDDFHASIPLESKVLDAVVIYGNDSAPLESSSGGPFRFFIPEHEACQVDEIDECANVKFLNHIEITSEKGFDNRPKDEDEHARLHQHGD